MNGKPIFDTAGRFIGYRGTATDITEQVEAEQRFRAIFESANIAMLIVGLDGRILHTNQGLADLLGYGEDELLAMSVVDITHPDDRGVTSNYMARLGTGRLSSLGVEKRYRRKDGDTVWGLLSIAAVKGPEEARPLYLVSAIQDISIQKAQAQSLLDSEARYRRAAKLARTGHWVWDHIEDRCVYCSPEMAALFGVSDDEFLSRASSRDAYLHWVHTDDRDDYAAGLAKSVADNAGYEKVVRVVLDDGRIRYHHQLTEAVLDATGKLMQTVGVLLDITEHRETEEALRQSQKLEAIGKLTGGIAHDLNNILSVVLGNLELTRELTGDSAVSKAVDKAMSATQRGAKLTNRLLAFGRRQPLSPKAVDLAALLRDMADLLHRSLGEDIELEIVAGDGLWACRVDPHQLENVILNLSINARDAMPDGGKLTIQAANGRLDQNYAEHHADVSPGQYVCLAVSDMGTGMSAEVAEKAFDPFFTTKDPGQGTGLGLSTAHGFVKQSGGHIEIHSEPGEGTTVKVYLPRTRDAADLAVEAPSTDHPAAGNGKVILVVEDDADLRAVITEQLADLDYEVREASCAADALAPLSGSQDVDLLLTDVVLPGGMNGFELARACREVSPGVRVLFMSGYAGSTLLHQRGQDEGAELIQKPFGKAALSERIHGIFAKPPEAVSRGPSG